MKQRFFYSKIVACTINTLWSSYDDYHEWCLYNKWVITLPLASSMMIISDASNCCITHDDSTGVNLTNILWAGSAPKSFCQKITNPNCKHLKPVQRTLVWLSISQIFYKQHFHTKVLCAPFMCLQFGFVIFWRKDFGAKAAHKMLVKLTPGVIYDHNIYTIQVTFLCRITQL